MQIQESKPKRKNSILVTKAASHINKKNLIQCKYIMQLPTLLEKSTAKTLALGHSPMQKYLLKNWAEQGNQILEKKRIWGRCVDLVYKSVEYKSM